MTEFTGTLWVAGGGAIGAFCRFQISGWFADWFGKSFPFGPLFVNVLGSFVMGLLVRSRASPGTTLSAKVFSAR